PAVGGPVVLGARRVMAVVARVPDLSRGGLAALVHSPRRELPDCRVAGALRDRVRAGLLPRRAGLLAAALPAAACGAGRAGRLDHARADLTGLGELQWRGFPPVRPGPRRAERDVLQSLAQTVAHRRLRVRGDRRLYLRDLFMGADEESPGLAD